MSMFQGHFNSGAIKNHVFTTNDKEMEALGLHSFNTESFPKIWNANLDLIKQAVTVTNLEKLTTGTLFNTGFFQIYIPLGEYVYYDKIAETFATGVVTYAEATGLIDYYEKRTIEDASTPKNESREQLIKHIKTSMSKSLQFKFPATMISSPLTGDIIYDLKFLERDLDSEEDKEERTIGLSTNISYAGVAKTVTGNPFNWKNTYGQTSSSRVGQKSGLNEGGIKNPTNTVAAPVDYYINEGTGKYESGTRRMLATLLDDIEPAPIKKIEITATELSNLSPDNFTDKESSLFTPYVPTTGRAMPYGVQNNNPALFTPNFIKTCKDPNKPYQAETVVVTNRFNKTYKKGTVLFLTRVGLEWIPEEQAQDPVAVSLKIGEWTFSKLIASSDEYFKDDSWATANPRPWSSRKYTPYDYEQAARRKFYTDAYSNNSGVINNNATYAPSVNMTFLNNSGTAPDYIENFTPNGRYYISTSFDQMKQSAGGFASAALISRTNMNRGEFDGELKQMRELGLFWGPVYVDGYKSIITDLSLNSPDYSGVYYQAPTSNNPITGLGYSNCTKPNSTIIPLNNSNVYSPTKDDIPAECTSKIFNEIRTWNKYYTLGLDQANGDSFLDKHILYPPYQKSVKNNRNKIQYIPLSADFVGANDVYAVGNSMPLSYERFYYTRVREYYNTYYTIGISTDTLWNSLWNSNDIMFEKRRLVPAPTLQKFPNLSQKCQFTNNFLTGGYITYPRLYPKPIITYDCYIFKEVFDKPVGVPENVFDIYSPGASCVGIICGKTTISKNGGGNINLNTISTFGLPAYGSVAGGQYNLSILPIGGIGIPLLMANDIRNRAGIPQFGSYSDEIYSFGTTVLATRVFDAWPENLTLFDSRYFGILHFNDGKLGSVPTTSVVKVPSGTVVNGVKLDSERDMTIDNISTSVDFRIPTYWSGPPISSTAISIDTIIPSGESRVAPKAFWKVNPIRRGMMLTGDGFQYPHYKIGARTLQINTGTVFDVERSTLVNKIFKGKRYNAGETYVLKNNLEIKITSVDSNGGIDTFNIEYNNISGYLRGDFSGGDFPQVFTLPIKKDGNGNVIDGAEAAQIKMIDGIVYSTSVTDTPPKEQVPLTRISAASNAGKAMVDGVSIQNQFSLESNKTGKYDVFTHFHNDITHTIMYHPYYGATQLQQITLEIA